MGYDISDYKQIDPIYGTNEDIDLLVAELKKRDMKLMMDLVVNHTSDQVGLALSSKESYQGSRRLYYSMNGLKNPSPQRHPQSATGTSGNRPKATTPMATPYLPTTGRRSSATPTAPGHMTPQARSSISPFSPPSSPISTGRSPPSAPPFTTS